MVAEKFADDGFTRALANLLDERVGRIRRIVQEDTTCSRDEIAKFIWSTVKAVRKLINPDSKGASRLKGWADAKGMLKEIVDFNKFSPLKFDDDSISAVLERKVFDVLDRYKCFVLTGEVRTKYPPPKLLGETDEIICVDKPCNFICSYGGGGEDQNMDVPELQHASCPSALLNGDKAEIQIHEYLSLKYNYETAQGTRDWWALGETKLKCNCGRCDYCACTQGGCCNRLDRETSGVMVIAKTKAGFKMVREQFSSEHNLEKGGTEKYYLALVHGTVQVPTEPVWKSSTWLHSEEGGRGKVEISQRWDGRKSVAWDKGEGPAENAGSRQHALTYYEPVAWLTRKAKGWQEKLTLIHLQIVTGRRHQIRFHCSEVGYSLVGDITYGAPNSDREWAGRVFLHSYQTKFREPFTERWFEAFSPLPQELGEILEQLTVDRIAEKWSTSKVLSRRDHPKASSFVKQYDPMVQLLRSHDPPKVVMNPQERAAAAAAGKEAQEQTHKAWKASKAGKDGGGNDWSSGSWSGQKWQKGNDKSWKGDGWTGSGWEDSSATEAAVEPSAPVPAPAPDPAAAPVPAPPATDDDSDDAWGDWGSGGAPKTAPSEAIAAPQPKAGAWPVPPEQPRPSSAPPPEKKQRIEPPMPVATEVQQVPQVQRLPNTPPEVVAPAPPPNGGWSRRESRSVKGVYYYWNSITNATQAEPPAPWELKQSRSNASVHYYWNAQTNATSVEKPEL
eukprot:TRINITY_DN24827_c0_g3_i1.p1 TRINITY_DN24827_c0_g3~~TRINITY_DN24827_c0_g3_i1.p1  ORF type:complete len:730 (+),score=123.94 TRINITY_DN24827_c0_g3_i1:134-2323(+)